MSEERPRFGSRNLLAAVALAAYGWFAAAYGPDGSFPGSDFGSLAYGLSRQGLWFVPIGILIPLVLPGCGASSAVSFWFCSLRS